MGTCVSGWHAPCVLPRMSLFSRIKDAFSPSPTILPRPEDGPDTAAALEVLGRVMDPELGIDLVSLGLVRRVQRAEGTVQVDLTATSSACPLGPWLLEQCREHLALRFPEDQVEVALVWSPPWRPEDMNDEARAKLGR